MGAGVTRGGGAGSSVAKGKTGRQIQRAGRNKHLDDIMGNGPFGLTEVPRGLHRKSVVIVSTTVKSYRCKRGSLPHLYVPVQNHHIFLSEVVLFYSLCQDTTFLGTVDIPDYNET